MRKSTAMSLIGSLDSMIVQMQAIKMVLHEVSTKSDKRTKQAESHDDLVLSQNEESIVERELNAAFKFARSQTHALADTVKEEFYEEKSSSAEQKT